VGEGSPSKQPEHYRKYQKKHIAALRLEALSYYSQGLLKCSRCGFSDIRALCLDHTDGDGRFDREHFRGSRLCLHLKYEGFPSGYQVLCANCNLIKARENGEFGVKREERPG
jgi:hypothetical protein